MTDRVAIAMSGGVDSLVAARLLMDSGADAFGVHFFSGFEPGGRKALPRRLTEAAGLLGLPLFPVDLSSAFEERVVAPFARAYEAGRTPNPCMLCNPTIKFGALLDEALKLGADALATGHYARVVPDDGGRPRLCRGADPAKDQSYFLARLGPSTLSRARFPLGGLTKDEVRKMARDLGLSQFARAESQEICFISGNDYRAFLEERGIAGRPGEIVTMEGKVLGRHQGLTRYTVGQRRGLDCPADRPLYVIRLNMAENRLVVGYVEELAARAMRVEDLLWNPEPPKGPLRVQARIRYRSAPAPALVEPLPGNRARVVFDKPQKAVTPGQGAVFYDGDQVLGSGWIKGPED